MWRVYPHEHINQDRLFRVDDVQERNGKDARFCIVSDLNRSQADDIVEAYDREQVLERMNERYDRLRRVLAVLLFGAILQLIAILSMLLAG